LEIFDVSGRLMSSLVNGTLPAGRHEISWNALDPHGHRLDSGVYFYILETAGKQISKRMLLIE
jgi:hypothetical protein